MQFNSFKIQYGTIIYIVPSPVPRQVQREQFHQKDELHIHSVAIVCRVYVLHSLIGTIHQQTQHRKSSCYFQNLFFYTLLCSFFAVFAVWLVLYKNYKPQNTMPKCILSLEYSQSAQLDSGFCVTLHYHHRPSPL